MVIAKDLTLGSRVVVLAGKAFDAYIESVRSFCYQKFETEIDLRKPPIFIDLLSDHPAYLLSNLIQAKYLQRITRAPLHGIIYLGKNKEAIEKLATAFGVTNFSPTISSAFDWKYLRSFPKIYFDGLKYYFRSRAQTKTALDLENLHIDGAPLGDCIYDSVLRYNNSCFSITKIDHTVRRELYFATQIYSRFKNLFSKGATALVMGRSIYTKHCIPLRAALKQEIPVLTKIFEILPLQVLSWNKNQEDSDLYQYRFSEKDFDEVFRNSKSELVNLGKEYLAQRFGAQTDQNYIDVQLSFGREKKTYDRRSLFQKFNWDPQIKTVGIFPRDFKEAAHFFGRKALYRDSYTWLLNTLKTIQKRTNIQWLIKEHPASGISGYSIGKLPEFSSFLTEPHIRLAPADMNTAALVDILDALVVDRGTAGLEFSALGKPCVIAGPSYYTGHGFTFDSSDHETYTNLLNRIETLSLSSEAQQRATTYAYLYFVGSRISSPFIPKEGSQYRSMVPNSEQWESQFWVDALQSLSQHSPEDDSLLRGIKDLFENKKRHVFFLAPKTISIPVSQITPEVAP